MTLNERRTEGASKRAIQAHYDLSNDFYALWLGKSMAYSGALWGPDDDLDAAQIRKFDHHITEANVRAARRVLDIGCGWGGVLRRISDLRSAGEVHPQCAAVGLTLSEAQARWVEGMHLSQTEVRVESWSDYVTDQPFQSIISVGAFEHFARPEFSEADKVAAYARFFARCFELLDKDGMLSLQTFAYGSGQVRESALRSEGSAFIAAEIFQETDPPTLANIATALRGTFELVRLHNDRLGYARTCKVWLEGLRAQRDAIVEMVGAETFERYRRYLNFAFAGFTTGNLDLYRITLRRLPRRVATALP